MKKLSVVLLIIVVLVVGFMLSTLSSPVLIMADDVEEGGGGAVDMAAKFSITGFEWIYPGSSVNAQGQTLHNIHLDSPDDPYGAARDIMTYTYNFTPHLIVSINNDGAEAIFGTSIVDDIRANDAYNGYAGNDKVQGTMSRGDAVNAAMTKNGMNVFQIPIQALLGNIAFHFV
ncbi:MAG: hypothetical protein J6M91_04255 [Methanobrevibacter sp.]|uniref:hypothetical protein n=1 Tax=Methanobrevibacter sp. TaxID=66852 RepID=UPI001B192B76|nr:hypothetical protein [Methanobrevibacter sp.]MBO5152304.1 hypothetical protein [Methanobrevibacter sp.]MBO6274741.1 hypothetical protein [Methanobrevibacter sp.]